MVIHIGITSSQWGDLSVRFPQIHKVNLRTLTERHVITFRKQLISLLYQPALAILVKLGEINMTPLIIENHINKI
jgi:hypothetical protein